MSRERGQNGGNGVSVSRFAEREARLAALLVQIADGRAAPIPSNEKEALAAMTRGSSGYRRFYCRWYGHCLDYAVIAKWDGFKCVLCVVNESVDEAARRAENRALLRAISGFDVDVPYGERR